VLLVSKDGKIRNIDGARDAVPTKIEDGREVTADEIFNSPDTEIELNEEEMHQSEICSSLFRFRMLTLYAQGMRLRNSK
jgi:hypothetical protein